MISDIISNIFLLIISILKILSSIYIPLIIITFTIVSIILYLSKRILVLPCNKCDNGSWWYKCKENTGFGSDSCKNLVEIVHKTVDMYQFIIDFPNKIRRITNVFLYHSYNSLTKWIYFMKNIVTILLKLNPTYFIFKLLVEPFMKIITSIFTKLINAVKSLSFGFVIPVIDIDINIGKLIRVPFEAIMKLFNLLFNTVVNVFSTFARFVFDEIIQPIINAMSNVISSVMRIISNMLRDILKEFKVFFNQIDEVSKLVNSISAGNIIQLIIENVIKWTTEYILFPLQSIPYIGFIISNILLNPYILFYIVIVPPMIIFLLVFIGQILSVVNLVKHIIYMFIGCDNDVDFIIIIINILEYLKILNK